MIRSVNLPGTKHSLFYSDLYQKVKVNVHTHDIAPLHSESPPQKRSVSSPATAKSKSSPKSTSFKSKSAKPT